ncbi:hypothetical protein LOAG_01983 [Loa loa]|uniref:Uncharacterized protein n=1 Tax=Loa loa TaxID=7209 RepID=A0A1S0U7G2_LOALO|nr:hypothetical protein LOAG_01983 [Loa loa]EFO26497.1 hypothetical protein LOAG_01983 [Loa loa]
MGPQFSVTDRRPWMGYVMLMGSKVTDKLTNKFVANLKRKSSEIHHGDFTARHSDRLLILLRWMTRNGTCCSVIQHEDLVLLLCCITKRQQLRVKYAYDVRTKKFD